MFWYSVKFLNGADYSQCHLKNGKKIGKSLRSQDLTGCNKSRAFGLAEILLFGWDSYDPTATLGEVGLYNRPTRDRRGF